MIYWLDFYNFKSYWIKFQVFHSQIKHKSTENMQEKENYIVNKFTKEVNQVIVKPIKKPYLRNKAPKTYRKKTKKIKSLNHSLYDVN